MQNDNESMLFHCALNYFSGILCSIFQSNQIKQPHPQVNYVCLQQIMEQDCSIDFLSFYYYLQQEIVSSIKFQDNNCIASCIPFMIKATGHLPWQ